jgi:hypothetical protein
MSQYDPPTELIASIYNLMSFYENAVIGKAINASNVAQVLSHEMLRRVNVECRLASVYHYGEIDATIGGPIIIVDISSVVGDQLTAGIDSVGELNCTIGPLVC